MRLLTMILITLTLFVGCFFDSGDEKAPVSSSISSSSVEVSSSSVEVSSSSVEASNRLTIPGQAALKRVTLDGYFNRIISKETVRDDSAYGDYDVVTINWGILLPEKRDFTYYLTTTGEEPVQMDSVVISDKDLKVNKTLSGFEVITNRIGMTGDEILPLTYNPFPFCKKAFDSTITMTVYGTELNTGKRTKLEVRFLVGSAPTKGVYEYCAYGYDSALVYRTPPMHYKLNRGVVPMDTSWVIYPEPDVEGVPCIPLGNSNYRGPDVTLPHGEVVETQIYEIIDIERRKLYLKDGAIMVEK